MMRLGVLASHEGTTLQVVIDACQAERLRAKVGLVISNNGGSGALRRAAHANIPHQHISSRTHVDEDTAIRDALQAANVELVLLLGYMKRLGEKTLSAFDNKVLNTHPALLPKFGGQGFFGNKVHAAVLDAGETESGATLHWVTADYDTGPTLAQAKVPVLASDTVDQLADRVKTAEQALLIDSLAKLARQNG